MTKFIRAVLVAVALPFSSSYAGNFYLTMISLDEATKQVRRDDRIKVLGAKTELIGEKPVHIIKILTPDGRIQYQRIDAETGQIMSRDE
ncbi:MAG: hypothetical protein Kow0065_12210 [Methylomicrobium sp.]